MADVPSYHGPTTRDGHPTRPQAPNSHGHNLPYPSRNPSSPTSPETFLCTFCWRPQRSDPANSSNAPRVVGSRARLACEPCHNALLDLAIC
ncbi:hypothetical protein F5883DRAFT_576269 [Diaporthe sp. PMI_573]|nr:hypothetical protein F5883DRAFT_576269 [Diaporthaceae sp. PMI_573]